MKINQNKSKFNPITITLENITEALAFINMIDKVENNRTSIPPQSFTKQEIDLVIRISDAFTNGEVKI